MRSKKRNIERTLLIDHDIVCFRYASTHEYTANWGNGTVSKIVQLEQSKYGMCQFIQGLIDKVKATEVVLCMTGDFNFRYGVLPTYKHNRSDKERPVLLDQLKSWSRDNFETCEIRGLEADDILGIIGSSDPQKYVVATIDKDLKSVPCTLYLWNKDTLETITVEAADYHFFYQILIGDSTDGYTGCPGVGQKKAEELLNTTPRNQWWQMVLDQYAAAFQKAEDNQLNEKLTEKTRTTHRNTIELFNTAGGVSEYALQQARVARILRNGEYDESKKKPILWNPLTNGEYVERKEDRS